MTASKGELEMTIPPSIPPVSEYPYAALGAAVRQLQRRKPGKGVTTDWVDGFDAGYEAGQRSVSESQGTGAVGQLSEEDVAALTLTKENSK